jgi:hypothetical protein
VAIVVTLGGNNGVLLKEEESPAPMVTGETEIVAIIMGVVCFAIFPNGKN